MKKQKNESDKPLTLSDGQHVIVNGQEMVVDNGGFRLPEVDGQGENEKHFYIYFSSQFTKDIDEVDGCKVHKFGKYTALDIFPLIDKLFGGSAWLAGNQFSGVEFVSGSSDEARNVQLPFSDILQGRLESKINRMFDMSVVNQNQRKGFESYVNEMFRDVWRDFYTKL